MNPIGIGVIGFGRRMGAVIRHLRASAEDLRLVAVCDPDPSAIQRFRRDCSSEARAMEDARELCADPDLEWVMVGSWNCCHADHVIAAFEAGKHVFCEKPLALTLEDCLRMRDAWKKSGCQFSMGFTLRYSAHYQKIHELVSGGKIGTILSLEFNETLDFNHGGYIHADWRRKSEWAGSHMLEKCSHDLDLVNWMVGSTPVRVASFGGCDFFREENRGHVARLGKDEEGHDAFQTWSQRLDSVAPGNLLDPFNDDKDIVDNQVAILEYANGVRASFHTNCLSAIPERRMVLCGTEGTIRADVITGSIELKRLGFDTVVEDHSTSARGSHGDGDRVLGKSLADSMLKGVPPLTGLEDGLKAAQAAFAIDEALRAQGVVSVAGI